LFSVSLGPLGFLLVTCFAGCGGPTVETPEQLILYSIDGQVERTSNSTTDQLFHGYPILGKIEIKEPADRTTIMRALAQGIAKSDGNRAACFWPRHAIHAVHKGTSIDYVICFQCLQLVIEQNSRTTMKATTRDPEPTFNKYLANAGIPIAPH